MTLSARARQQVIEEAMPAIHALARRIGRRGGADPDELAQEGNVAATVLSAVFDPGLGTSFEAFAMKRVRGAMLDHLRREKRRSGRSARLFSETDERLGVGVEDISLQEIVLDQRSPRDALTDYLEGRALDLTLGVMVSVDASAEEAAVLDRLHFADVARWVQRSVARLGQDEQTFYRLRYKSGLPLEEIATRMGVVKRTAQRIQDRVRSALAKELDALG